MTIDTAGLMVATLAPGGLVHVDHVATLVDLARSGVALTHVTASGERDAERARNAMVSAFHLRRGAGHLLFLDADIGMAASDVIRMLGHRRDVVAAAVPLEAPGPGGEPRYDIGPAVGEDGPLTLHEHTGASALLLSLRAVDALVEEARGAGFAYESTTPLGGDPGARIDYDVFRGGAADGAYVTGAVRACATLRRLGFAIHVDPAVVARRHRIAVL